MAKKLEFNSSISEDLKAASADSFADNIKMIDIADIMPNKDNFYDLSALELLADDIEREGLKHNLVVSKDKSSDKYWLISGHRRLEAVRMLIKEGRLKSKLLPCYINGEKSQAESRLDIIMLNATQRKYSDIELINEYEQLTETLTELDREGKRLSGRMRENIAKILNVSNGQVAKMDKIRNKAVDEVKNAVKNGEMSISTASEVANLDPAEQKEIAEKKPDIKYSDVKAKQTSTAPAPEKTDTDIESDMENEETDVVDEDIPAPKPQKPKDDHLPPLPQKKAVMFTEREIRVLLQYIDDIILSCGSEADELALHGIKDSLKACSKA